DVLLLALKLFRDFSIDYIEACLAVEARLTGLAVASFDTDFEKVPKLTGSVLSLRPCRMIRGRGVFSRGRSRLGRGESDVCSRRLQDQHDHGRVFEIARHV